MLKEMSKLKMLGPKAVLPLVIERLYAQKILHIVEQGEGDHGSHNLMKGRPQAGAEQLSGGLVKAHAIAASLGIPLEKGASVKPTARIFSEIESISSKLKSAEEKAREAEDRISACERQLEKYRMLALLKLSAKSLVPYSSLDWFIGFIRNADFFEEHLRLRTTRTETKLAKVGKLDLVAVFVDKAHAEGVRSVLTQHDFTALDVKDVTSNPQALKKQLVSAKTERKEALEVKSELRKAYRSSLPGIISGLTSELKKAEAPLRFNESERTFLITGFVPKQDIKNVMSDLSKHTKQRIYFEEVEIDSHHDKVPILLKNPPGVRSFEFFLNLYTLPKYREIDPSWFMFITFPLLFGFMLGDVGYGFVCLLIFIAMKKLMPQFSGFFTILELSSLGSMIFGAIFGEYFGYEFYHPLINRNPAHSLYPLMIAAVVFGVLHVNAGIIAGFVNEYKSHGFKHAMMGKGGWFVLQIGVALLALSFTPIFRIIPWVKYTVSSAIILAGIMVIYKGEGIIGAVEIPGIFANFLSYLRLMAIGLSSVGLALVINNAANGFFASGGYMIIFGVLILAVGHIINLALGIMGGFLHSLRLHYVELFSKFYKGGGITFKPFGVEE